MSVSFKLCLQSQCFKVVSIFYIIRCGRGWWIDVTWYDDNLRPFINMNKVFHSTWQRCGLSQYFFGSLQLHNIYIYRFIFGDHCKQRFHIKFISAPSLVNSFNDLGRLLCASSGKVQTNILARILRLACRAMVLWMTATTSSTHPAPAWSLGGQLHTMANL